MANVKITDLPSLTGASSASTDVLPVVDVSADTTSKMTRAEFFLNVPAVTTTGNVGVGIASPTSKLHVYDANTAISMNEVAAAGTGVASTRWKYSTNQFGLYVGTTNALVTYDYGASAERMRIDSSGNVGIGTTSVTPIFGRTVQIGDGSTTSSISLVGTGAGTTGDVYLASTGSEASLTARASTPLTLGAGGSERFRIGDLGQWGIGGANYGTSGQTIISAGSGAAPAWGTLPVAGGGTGAATLTGYVKGSGTSAMTASATIPNTDVSGLGTMSTQAASAVAITGGTINSASVGATTASTGAFTTLSASSTVSGTGFSTYLASPPAIGGTTPASVRGSSLTSDGTITDGYNAHANGTLALAFGTDGVCKVTPTATGTFTSTVPPAGTRATLIVLTSGTTTYTMTFGTGFKTTGVLVTGVLSARYFILEFISDGTNLIESSRTIAIA